MKPNELSDPFLKLAAREALQSEYKNHKVGCIITDRKGTVISTGFNKKWHSHPKQKEYEKKAGIHKRSFIHAEIHALVRAARSNKIPYAIYVARVTGGGNIGLSRPCAVCTLAIKEAGIKEVKFTI